MSVQTSPDGQPAAREIERVLVELLALEREVFELEYMRRADALERTGDAVRVLGELRSTDGILARAAAEFGVASQFDRILISEVTDDGMLPLALWDGIREAGDTTRTTCDGADPAHLPVDRGRCRTASATSRPCQLPMAAGERWHSCSAPRRMSWRR